MKRFIVFNTLLTMCCIGQLQAELVSVDEDFINVGNYNSNVTEFNFSIDSNAATGNIVTCIGTEVSNVAEGTRYNIECFVHDSDGNEISNIFLSSLSSLSTTGDSYSIDLGDLDVGVTDDNDLYVLWTGSDIAFVQAFDIDGNALFDPVELITDAGFWWNVNLAVTESSFWVVGTSETDVGTFSLFDIEVFYYDSLGNLQGEILQFESTLDSFLTEDCTSSDVASSASGDLIVTWVEPVDRDDDSCAGSVYAQTYRESGTVISDATQLSDDVEDDDGDDVSNFYSPVATAYENGEYVVAWTDGSTVYSANLLLDGDLADSQEELISGDSPNIGGNSATQDYLVTSELTSGSDCVIEAQLAFDADTDPEVVFSPGDCNEGHDITFAQDGSMLLVQATGLTNNFGFFYVSRISLPAEIEVSAVSVQEGDPVRGIQNVAVIDVSLTRAQPAGDDIEVSYFTRDDTALVGIDYELADGTLTFPADSTSLTQSIQVPIVPDTDYEDDEIFTINLENAINAVLKNDGDEADITINNDDSTPDITADCDNDDASDCKTVDEPGITGTSTELIITLTMAESVDSDITVDFETVDGTATAGSDYLANSGTLQYLAGSTQAQIAVIILGDDVSEDTETFDISLSGASTVSLPDATLTISIINETLCDLDLDPDPNDVVVTSAGGDESFTVNSTLSDCAWEVDVTDTDGGDTIDWITITSATGVGSGTVEFSVDPFDPDPGESLARNADINVTLSASNDPFVDVTVTFEVGQDGDCSFTVDPSSEDFDVDGGTGTFSVTPNDESCEWSATSDVSWLSIDSPTGIATGSGSVEYTLSDNAGDANVENDARSYTIISEEFDYSITQDGCTYTLDETSIDVTADSTDTSVDILAPTSASGSCSWTAVSNSSWILISDGSSGSGGGTISMAILDNASVESRTGSVSIGGQTLAVSQSGQDCDYSVDPESFSICPDGDTFDIDVTATDGCSWSMVAQDSWLEVLTNATGIGSETTSGVVLSNLSQVDRSGSIELQATTRGSTQATIDFSQDGFLIYETFEGGLPADWLFDPDVDWSVSGNVLIGDLLNQGTGTALDMSTACSDCKVESTVMVTTASNGSMDVLTLIGWYVDETNYVGLAMDEFTNNWRLLQVFDGGTTAVETNIGPIVPNVPYDVGLGYDGSNFIAEVGGADILTLPAQFSMPVGYTGFMLNENNGQFTELRVIGSSGDVEDMLNDSFEAVDDSSLSVCTQ